MVCDFGHQFFFTDIKQLLLAHGYVALTNGMLKAYKVAQVCIFLSGWMQEAYFLKTNNNNLCISRTKCSPSQTLDDDPTMYRYCAKDDGFTSGAYCFSTAGYEIYASFLYSLSCLCSANSGLLDNKRRDCNQSWLKCS